MWLLPTDCTCFHNCKHKRGFIWLRRCLARSLMIWLTFLWLSTALEAAAQTLFCACNVQPSVRLHCAADSTTNTARSFAGEDTNMRPMFHARWTVLLQHVTAAHCVCMRIVCVSLRARAHSRVPRRLSADAHNRGRRFPFTLLGCSDVLLRLAGGGFYLGGAAAPARPAVASARDNGRPRRSVGPAAPGV